MPVSTTHSLLGAIVVCGAVAFGPANIHWGKVAGRFVLPLLASPFIATVLAWALFAGVRAIFRSCHDGACRICHWVSSMASCFARAFNDIPKIAGVLSVYYLAVGEQVPARMLGIFAFLSVAAMLGALIGGLRVTETLAYRVTNMDHDEGLTANLTTGLLVITTALRGLPVSTTHVSSGAIIGMGLQEGARAVHWDTVRNMALAWIVTLPVSGLVSASIYQVWANRAVGLPATVSLFLLTLLAVRGWERRTCSPRPGGGAGARPSG